MSRVWRAVLIVVLCIPSVFKGSQAQDETWERLFFESNQAYRESRFQEAIEGYRKLIQSGHKNGHFYYNLGNAYFRLHDLGRAILNYERARLLIPRDVDLNFNLRNAYGQTRDVLSTSPNILTMTFFWLNDMSLDELFWAFALLNFLFWGVLLMRLVLRSEWMYYLSLILLIFWLMAAASFGLKWYQVKSDSRAVILQEQVSVLSGPDIRDTILFELHAGTIVHLERKEEGWSLVRLPDEKRGWVKSDVIGAIANDRLT